MQLRSANFRVALFQLEACGKGTGSWMIRCTLEFAFQALRLHRLSLDVFGLITGPSGHTKRRAFAVRVFCGTLFGTAGPMPTDILAMSMLEEEWRALYPARPALPEE